MKKGLVILLIAAMLACCVGCKSNNAKPDDGPIKDIQIDSQVVNTQIQWNAQYIRTNGGFEASVAYPSVKIIHSAQQLRDYYDTWREVFYLERQEKVYSDSPIGFLDACDRYDDSFFEEHYLIFVLWEEGSGSVSHEVKSVQQTSDHKISISIDRITPEVGTADMAEWHIILELSQDSRVESPDDVLVYFDDVLFWNGSIVEPPRPEPAFKTPPKGVMSTPEGDVALILAGFDWTFLNSDGTAVTTIADQAGRPLPQDHLQPVTINSKYAETIYLPVPGSTVYEPTNALGYSIKLYWEATPSRVTVTCWPDTVWAADGVEGEEMSFDLNGGPFYAKEGGYVYEFAVTWDDDGSGCYGTANYYVYIVGGEDHSHQMAQSPQTVDDPVTGYCGNTWTTLYIGDKEYSFMYGNSVTLTDILLNLDYDPVRVCKCLPEYIVDTAFGKGYGINLSEGYARCEKGQADLTREQVEQIVSIILWAETTNCKYPME